MKLVLLGELAVGVHVCFGGFVCLFLSETWFILDPLIHNSFLQVSPKI